MAHVFGRELRIGRVVEGAACYGAAFAVRILKDRVTEAGVGRVARSFAIRPAVVRPGDAIIDFFPGILADIVDEDPAGSGLNGKREWIAKAKGPDGAIRARGGGKERIVTRNGAVGIKAKNFSQEIGQRLGIG